MDRLFRHGRLLYLGPRVKITQERRESQESTWPTSQNDRQNFSTGHLWVAERGAEDCPRAGGAAVGGLRQRDRRPSSLHLPLEGKSGVSEGIFAVDQDERSPICGGARRGAQTARLRGPGDYRIADRGGLARIF